MTITFPSKPDKGYPKTRRRLEGSRIVHSAQYRFTLISNDDDEDGLVILAQVPAILAIGVDLGGGFTVREHSLSRDPTARLKWTLDVSADDQVTEKEKEDKDKPPDQRRSEWSWDFETEEIAFTKDRDDRPVVNSAGDPIEVTTPVIIPVLNIERQERSFDPNTILNFCNHVNDASFWGAPAGAVLCAGIRERKGETFNRVEYRAVSYTFKFRIPEVQNVIEGWKILLVDHGPNIINANGELEAFVDANGRKLTTNLDGAGATQDPGDPPYILRFKQFPEADFGQLNLNWPLS